MTPVRAPLTLVRRVAEHLDAVACAVNVGDLANANALMAEAWGWVRQSIPALMKRGVWAGRGSVEHGPLGEAVTTGEYSEAVVYDDLRAARRQAAAELAKLKRGPQLAQELHRAGLGPRRLARAAAMSSRELEAYWRHTHDVRSLADAWQSWCLDLCRVQCVLNALREADGQAETTTPSRYGVAAA